MLSASLCQKAPKKEFFGALPLLKWGKFLFASGALFCLPADGAVLVAVAEVNNAADKAPDKKANPGVQRQVVHQVQAGKDC